ncbi:hypothetical protein EDC04DRAFT_2887901 [Pisolithus marmoratus]|nr:hypothetical protein EDC04DRAFT_2887901 [Pisolithus marmoratus]
MRLLALTAVFSMFAVGVFATAIPSIPFLCEDAEVLTTHSIGRNEEVQAQVLSCSNRPSPTVDSVALAAPTNVCGHTCNTNCFTPAGGGPDPNDCQVIAHALLYANQNTGACHSIYDETKLHLHQGTNFNITVGSPIFMQYASCETFFVNQASYNETYCRNDWASVIEYVAFNCQAQQNAHGGNCVASDQTWFIQ